jgi:hypothetical protein
MEFAKGRQWHSTTILAGCIAVVLFLCSCFMNGDPRQGIIWPHPGPDWKPILSQSQIEIVRQTLPNFGPEVFAPGTDPTKENALTPFNFSPALFFGAPVPQGMRPTPLGIQVETNGYDGAPQPVVLPSQGTYFDRRLTPHQFTLPIIQRSPLNVLQGRMGLPLTPNAPVLSVNLTEGRVDLTEIDSAMLFIRDQLATLLPAVAGVDPRNYEIVIEPTIFYVAGTTIGNTWVGGLTEPLGGGRYRSDVLAFYMVFHLDGSTTMANWKDFLEDEAINFYVLSVGRNDLAR